MSEAKAVVETVETVETVSLDLPLYLSLDIYSGLLVFISLNFLSKRNRPKYYELNIYFGCTRSTCFCYHFYRHPVNIGRCRWPHIHRRVCRPATL